ncbi:MAG: bifunctional hydroxymethylpyrimidine kinase/phosphomethylpyrimidine kinase [Pirellulales bacterium]
MSVLMPVSVLSIAGSDPSGGAGLQADLKTFQQFGVYGMSAVTLLTVQNTVGVSAVEMIRAEFVCQQIDAVLDDIPPQAVKIGALGSSELVQVVSDRLLNHPSQVLRSAPVVVDPVMVSKHGHSLVADEFVHAFSNQIVPLATVITPNRFEAERLTGTKILKPNDAELAAQRIVSMGAKFALVKFGQANESYAVAIAADGYSTLLNQPFIPSNSTHGTGCILSAIVAAKLACLSQTRIETNWDSICEIVDGAMIQLGRALQFSSPFGRGIRPLKRESFEPKTEPANKIDRSPASLSARKLAL